MPHSPEALALINQRKKEARERWDGLRPIVDSRLGARTIGDMGLVEPGCEIWAKNSDLEDITNVRQWIDGDAKGGIVLEIVDFPLTNIDDQTGEIGEWRTTRAFRCWDYTRGIEHAYSTLTEAQVDPSTFAAPSIVRIRNQYRRICKHVATMTSVSSARELQWVIDAARMAAIVGAMTP